MVSSDTPLVVSLSNHEPDCTEDFTVVASYRVIGTRTPRVDGMDKVTGHARYAADYSLPGTIWGKTLSSPYSHARIVRIDTSAAKKLPGVHVVITGADTRDGGLWGRLVKDAPVLA